MATISDINTKITTLTGADTTSYPNATRVIDINQWQEKIVGMILDSQDESDFDDANRTDFPLITTSLVANQRDYAVPVSKGLLEWKRVEISYDGTNYYRATPIDSGEISVGLGNASEIDGYFSTSAPGYDTKGLSILLYPRPTASTGEVVVEYSRNMQAITTSDITTGTLVPGFDSTFHMMLAYGPAYEYAVANSLANRDEIKAQLDEYEQRLRRQYGRKQKDRNLGLRSVYSPNEFN